MLPCVVCFALVPGDAASGPTALQASDFLFILAQAVITCVTSFIDLNEFKKAELPQCLTEACDELPAKADGSKAGRENVIFGTYL